MPTLLPRKSMGDTSVISPPIQRPSPSDHRVGSSSSFTRLRVGSLALRPALLLCENLRPRVTTTPLPHATEAYGQLPGRDFNPLDLLLLLRTVGSRIKNLILTHDDTNRHWLYLRFIDDHDCHFRSHKSLSCQQPQSFLVFFHRHP